MCVCVWLLRDGTFTFIIEIKLSERRGILDIVRSFFFFARYVLTVDSLSTCSPCEIGHGDGWYVLSPPAEMK